MKNKVNLILIFLCVVFGTFYLTERQKQTEYTFSENIEKVDVSENIIEDENIIIDITGEVNKPDLYILPKGSLFKDAVDIAGGLTQNADITKINMERKLENKEKIIIESKLIEQFNNDTTKENNIGLININTADKETLKKLPKIGETIADNIIKYRENNGEFKSISEIKNVDRIGEKIFDEIKNLITI